MKKIILFLSVFLLLNFVCAEQMICVDFDHPSPPSNLAVTSSGQNIILTWGAATDIPACSGIDYYVIVRNGNIIFGNTTSLTFTDVNVPYGTYSYSVYAVDKVAHLGGLAIKNDVVLSAPSSVVTSGGGGSGGIRVIGGEAESSYVCYEDWQCGEWSECVDGEQTRTCTDTAKCGTTLNKPGLYQECLLTTQQTSRNFLTGAVTGITDFATSPGGIVTLTGMIILAVGGIIFFKFKKKYLKR